MLRAISDHDVDALLALNNLQAAELWWQKPGQFAALLLQACWTRTVGNGEALLVALDQDADYDSPNFVWLKARFQRFVYIDRGRRCCRARA